MSIEYCPMGCPWAAHGYVMLAHGLPTDIACCYMGNLWITHMRRARVAHITYGLIALDHIGRPWVTRGLVAFAINQYRHYPQ